jgi:hypothetical protein
MDGARKLRELLGLNECIFEVFQKELFGNHEYCHSHNDKASKA